MFSLEIVLLGFALAIDAALVTFTIGLLHMGLHLKTRTQRALLVSLTFGFFQFMMMWGGSYGGYLFSFSSYGYLFHFVVGAIFFLIALKFLHESFSQEVRELEWGIWPVVMLAVATSIDALVSGVSLGTLPQPYLASVEVGIITFSVCFCFYFLSQFFKQIPDKWLLRFAALILSVLGSQILWGVFSKGAA